MCLGGVSRFCRISETELSASVRHVPRGEPSARPAEGGGRQPSPAAVTSARQTRGVGGYFEKSSVPRQGPGAS